MIEVGQSITAIVFLLLAILVLFKGVRMVPQGYNWTIERFGKYTRTLNPGLHILIPFIDVVGRKLNMMEDPRFKDTDTATKIRKQNQKHRTRSA